MTGTKVEAIHSHGVPSTENFVVGRVLSAEPHPDADRLRVCTVDLGLPGGEPACIVCGAPNVAAGQTVAVARPGAVMPDGTRLKQGQAPGHRLRRDDPVRERARDRRRRRGHHGPRRRGRRRRRPAPSSHRSCRSRWRSSSSRSPRTGPTASASTGSRASCTRPPARRWRPSRGRRTPAQPGETAGRAGQRAVPRAVPAVHRPGAERRHDRPLAGMAEGAPDGRRAAPDQQRRRHHQLRDAPDRAAAARVRPRQGRGRRAHRAARRRRRAGARPWTGRSGRSTARWS